eukprot:6184742-Pleurochrysis_carterae.AAC.1
MLSAASMLTCMQVACVAAARASVRSCGSRFSAWALPAFRLHDSAVYRAQDGACVTVNDGEKYELAWLRDHKSASQKVELSNGGSA